MYYLHYKIILQIFKSKFCSWEEVIAVDFTRTAESVQKTGADLTKWALQQETKVKFILYFSSFRCFYYIPCNFEAVYRGQGLFSECITLLILILFYWVMKTDKTIFCSQLNHSKNVIDLKCCSITLFNFFIFN